MIRSQLSTLLGQRRMTIEHLRTISGVSYGALHQLYHDRTERYDRATLDRVCAALGVSVGELLEHRP